MASDMTICGLTITEVTLRLVDVVTVRGEIKADDFENAIASIAAVARWQSVAARLPFVVRC